MRRGVRLSAATLAMVMVATMPATALAGEGVRDRAISDQVVDRVSDLGEDREPDRVADRLDDRSSDGAIDVRPEPDRRTDRQIDREVDRVTDRCHPRIVDNVRRCLSDDRLHDFEIRHLIWRLIKAHEWEKLIRLLHWLGWL